METTNGKSRGDLFANLLGKLVLSVSSMCLGLLIAFSTQEKDPPKQLPEIMTNGVFEARVHYSKGMKEGFAIAVKLLKGEITADEANTNANAMVNDYQP